MRAEALPADLGVFCAITFAQSFHWMQREHVARAVHGMLEPERGRLILISAYTRSGVEPTAPTEHPVVPRAAITSLIETFLGSVRRAGASSLPEGTPWDEE